MISSLRKYATGWLGILLLVLIGLPFALSGVYSYVGGGGITVVAEVGDREISASEYQRAYTLYRQQLQALLGRNFRPELIDDARVRREALERLIDEIVLTETSLENGYRVSATQLAGQITATSAFQTDGRFDRDLYLQRLATQGMSPEGYEESLRTDLLARQLLDGVRSTALITPEYLAEMVRLQEQTRDVSYVVLDAGRFVGDEEPDPQDLEAFYREHGAAFRRPEQVRIDYIALRVDALAAGIEISDAELEQRYAEQVESLTAEEERRARHILVAVPAGADSAQRAAALAEANALREQLAGGAAFAEVAKSHSDDPGSAEQGGDLGYFGKGIMDPAFEAAAFSLPLATVSEPVLSSFGYHLIEVTETRGGERKSLAEVRDQLLMDARRRQAEQLFFEQAESMANLAYEHPDSLEPAAEAVGLEVQRSPWLTRTGSDWELAEPRVIDAAFSEEVLAEGVNSEVLELANDHILVLRLAEREVARQPELDEVRSAVVERYRAERAKAAAVVHGDALLEQLRGGARLADLAAGEDLETISVPGLRRDDRERPQPLVQAAFRLPRPADTGSPSVGSAQLPGGDVALLELTAVADGRLDDFPEAERAALRATLARIAGSGEADGVLSGLRERTRIRIIEQNL